MGFTRRRNAATFRYVGARNAGEGFTQRRNAATFRYVGARNAGVGFTRRRNAATFRYVGAYATAAGNQGVHAKDATQLRFATAGACNDEFGDEGFVSRKDATQLKERFEFLRWEDYPGGAPSSWRRTAVIAGVDGCRVGGVHAIPKTQRSYVSLRGGLQRGEWGSRKDATQQRFATWGLATGGGVHATPKGRSNAATFRYVGACDGKVGFTLLLWGSEGRS